MPEPPISLCSVKCSVCFKLSAFERDHFDLRPKGGATIFVFFVQNLGHFTLILPTAALTMPLVALLGPLRRRHSAGFMGLVAVGV